MKMEYNDWETKRPKVIDGDKFKGKFRKCLKKPIAVQAVQMKNDFFVTTMEGRVEGKKGDYLMIGIGDERYPCNKEIFEKSYDFMESE